MGGSKQGILSFLHQGQRLDSFQRIAGLHDSHSLARPPLPTPGAGFRPPALSPLPTTLPTPPPPSLASLRRFLPGCDFLTRKGAWHRLISCAGGLRGTHRKCADVNHLVPHRPETLNQSGRSKEWLACQPAIPWPESSPLASIRAGEPKNGCHASSDSLA